MKFLARNLTFVTIALVASGCQIRKIKDVQLGHACYRTFHYDHIPRVYGCLFELSAPSTFYDDGAMDRVVEQFMKDEGGVCTRRPERDVADVRTQAMDHGLRYRLINVECR